jgi:hypothetical protein
MLGLNYPLSYYSAPECDNQSPSAVDTLCTSIPDWNRAQWTT